MSARSRVLGLVLGLLGVDAFRLQPLQPRCWPTRWLARTTVPEASGIDIAVKGAIGFSGGWCRGFLFMLIAAIRSAVFDVLLSGHATRLPV